jgi:hypothetical protein
VPGARITWPTAVLTSALARPALLLTAAVPGGYGGGEGGGGKGGGDGGGGAGGGGLGGGSKGEGGGGDGDGGGGNGEGGDIGGLQSVQSVPRVQSLHSDPGPPSSHSLSEANIHISVQVCALVKPTIMARKIMRASRGADLMRPAEPHRAPSRHASEVTTQTR